MSRVCALSLKKCNHAYRVTYSHKRNHRKQFVNLQTKRIKIGDDWVVMKISTKAIKTLKTHGRLLHL
uniref:Large ribosomal subunit protein bL28c n=1 Tax=Cyanidiococcus yangmingshanensis TaxID=2690220 RepID=A0A7G5VUU2_9RHOD|nr:50S ribosomal protein L28 [Cyanidiococcus yangmingshanensis]QMX77459.1 50S ribosomal protein L28 [Cyanidiococcus yangmingshanensis]UNJ15878.1 ribosomal protein L28 [Cyanidioschyzonaceae sp. 2]UNJ16074.1 ribosomal protein L28 [Cyanidioschyzonaceae sp. 3]WDB00433.1 ribosomal protein L28 [Cyanidiococcus yangmingshanensis]